VFGVEMFLLADGSLLVNEVAPRPHNSGHYTIESCATSQVRRMRAPFWVCLGAARACSLLGLSRDRLRPSIAQRTHH
jgi:phosphoribosylaminoimidazole carboxylase (NCAIR synthetase)